MSLDAQQQLLVALARAAGPEWARFVVVGGAAHQLFRQSPLAQPVEFGVIRTFDADVAVDASAREPEFRVDEKLRQSDLHEELSGQGTPPAARYVLRTDPNHYIQFIAHRRGNGMRRAGATVTTSQVWGVVVEHLPHVDLLLSEPWTVELRADFGLSLGDELLRLNVANPTAYLAQKLLVLDRRAFEQRAKDLVYVYDALLIFAAKLDKLAALWKRIESPSSKRRAELKSKLDKLTATHRDDLHRAVEQIQKLGRRDAPDVQSLSTALTIGLTRIFVDSP